ncbi:MAG: hypothetical protein Q9169_006728 [Polycauliona sp. 2 TL-2023]
MLWENLSFGISCVKPADPLRSVGRSQALGPSRLIRAISPPTVEEEKEEEMEVQEEEEEEEEVKEAIPAAGLPSTQAELPALGKTPAMQSRQSTRTPSPSLDIIHPSIPTTTMPSSHTRPPSSNLEQCDNIQQWPEQNWDVPHWRDQVAEATRSRTRTRTRRPPAAPAATRSLRPPTCLYRPVARSYLGEIAHNRRVKPRTSPAAKATRPPKSSMAPVQGPQKDARSRRRKGGLGKGAGSDDDYDPTKEKPAQSSRVPRSNAAQRALQQPSQATYSGNPALLGPTKPPSSSRNSSNKSKNNTFSQMPSVTSLSMLDLESCEPPAKLRDFTSAVQECGQLSIAAKSLYDKLQACPRGLIPPTLKPAYETDASTPSKSKPPVQSHDYMNPDDVLYPKHRLPHLKDRVDRWLTMAHLNHAQEAHEHQWGFLFSLICDEVASWTEHNGLRVVNTEHCTIGPVELHTKFNGERLDYPKDVNNKIRDVDEPGDQEAKDGGRKKPESTISKMVDWCVGLMLTPQENALVSTAWRHLGGQWGERSLNQSLSFIRTTPLVIDVELKKNQQPSNPEKQLIIWASGAGAKRRHHKWDTSLPIPGITVKGHMWNYFISTRIKDDFVMIGPFEMGSTKNVRGIWQIIWHLDVLFRWGRTEYRKWFDENIMKWIRGLADGSQGSMAKGKELEKQTAELDLDDIF